MITIKDYELMPFQCYDTIGKTSQVLRENKNICVSVSGGSDSDVLIDIFTQHPDITKEHNIRFISFDTGLEYQATKDHIKDIELKYNIDIEVYKPIEPIPLAVKNNGTPFYSKQGDEFLMRLQKWGFDFKEDTKAGYLACLYNPKFWRPKNKKTKDTLWTCGCQGALAWYFGQNITINAPKYLREYCLENDLNLKVSNKCCKSAKKDVADKFNKDNQGMIDCWVIGMRKVEGGE